MEKAYDQDEIACRPGWGFYRSLPRRNLMHPA